MLLGLIVTVLPVLASAQTATPSEQNDPPERLQWTGFHRSRYARLLNQFRPGLTGNDQALTFVTMLRGEVALPRVRLLGEVQDVRAYLTDEQSNVSTALINAFDVVQAHLAGTTRSGTEWHFGRFTMTFGAGRLVAQEAFRDVTRAFTGGRARWSLPQGGALTGFATLPVITLPEDREGLLANEIEFDEQHRSFRFSGVYYEGSKRALGARADAYLFVLGEDDEAGKFETRNRHLETAGARWYRTPARGEWSFDLDAAVQRGTARASARPSDLRDLDVDAYYLHLSVGRTLARAWSPRLDLEYDEGSGDEDPTDGKWERFDMLFGARRVDLNPTSIYGALGRENISTLGVRLSLAPSDATDVFFVYRTVRLAEARDMFASSGVRDPSGASGRQAGRQLDIRWRRRLSESLRLDVGATHLTAGPFLENAPNATREGDTTFTYADVTYAFGGRP